MNFLVRRKPQGGTEKIPIKDARALWLSQRVRITHLDGSTETIPRDEVVSYKLRGILHLPWQGDSH